MKYRPQFLLVLFFLVSPSLTLYSQGIPNDSLYLGQIPPGHTPAIFQLPVSSGLHAVERISITSDGSEIYYSELDQWPPSSQRIKYFKYLNNKWQGPFIAFEGYVAPALSVNDSIIYMQKNENGVACTFYSIRNNTGWSTPSRLLSTSLQSHYFQETKLKNHYLASILPNSPGGNSDLCTLITHNSDTIIQSLGIPVNTSAIENDFFIARDESYIIFFRLSSPYDLYISYNHANDNWTNPKNLGIQINTPDYECCPFVTNDNKYLFFTRGGYEMSSYFTYWAKVDKLIDSLKHTNFIPYLKSTIPNQASIKDSLFNYQILDSTFIDDDGNNTLRYAATLSNGNHLPAWLSFDSVTHIFSGTPDTVTVYNVKVTATDTAGASASSTFRITVTSPTSSVGEEKERLPKGFMLNQNYPNPFNPSTVISYWLSVASNIKLTIYNILGQKIKTLVNSFQGVGEHSVVWNATDEKNNSMSSGIYFYLMEAERQIINKKMILMR